MQLINAAVILTYFKVSLDAIKKYTEIKTINILRSKSDLGIDYRYKHRCKHIKMNQIPQVSIPHEDQQSHCSRLFERRATIPTLKIYRILSQPRIKKCFSRNIIIAKFLQSQSLSDSIYTLRLFLSHMSASRNLILSVLYN